MQQIAKLPQEIADLIALGQQKTKELEAEVKRLKAEQHKRYGKLEKELGQIKVERLAPNRDCFTRAEVAKMAECSVETIRKAEKNGHLIPRFPNAKKRFHLNEVNWWLRGRMPPRPKKTR